MINGLITKVRLAKEPIISEKFNELTPEQIKDWSKKGFCELSHILKLENSTTGEAHY